MNAPVMTEAPSVAFPVEWRQVGLPIFVGLALLGVLFNKEVASAVETWAVSTAYNHCFLIVPIVLYLIWDRHRDLAGIAARPMPAALLLGVPLAAAWLVAERLGIMEGRQLVVVSFVQVLLLAVLGKRLWRAMAGPLLYLYFLVPFGEFLTPWLQDITTWFIGRGLELFGIATFIDGYTIEIPQGTFFVAEACAGLRFLIASVAFGCVYALLMYRGRVRRGVFIVVSVIVPIIANGLRGLGIVYLGYVLGSAEAAAADHVLYGWIFFSLVILLLIGLGLPFRQDHQSTRGDWSAAVGSGSAPSPRLAFGVAIGLVLVAAVSPVVAAGFAMAATPAASPRRIDVGPDCSLHLAARSAEAAVGSERVLCGGALMDMRWESFSSRATAAPVMAARRRMVAGALTEGLQEAWIVPDPGAWRMMMSNDPAYAVAVSVWVAGKPVRPGLSMRLRMAIDSLTGSSFAPMVVTVSPVVDWRTGNAAELNAAKDALDRFLMTHRGLDATVGALSALP